MLNRFKDYLLNKSDRYRFYKSEYTRLQQEKDTLKEKIEKLSYGPPPGHFYSPIVDLDFLKQREDLIWQPKFISGVQLNEKEQLNLIKSFTKYYPEMPFKSGKRPNLRYYFRNNYFGRGDGILLYSMIRSLKPNKIIEVGSGFSSALMMDVNDLFFGKEIDIKFIEPYPYRLNELMSEEDKKKYQYIPTIVQDTDLELFKQLEPNDILFIDGSHVVKTGSDVQHIFFKILPELKSGVYTHFHDIFYPFEYPKHWIFDNHWSWNEYYFLMAFLMHNTQFKIVLSANYLGHYHKKDIRNIGVDGGGSVWIKKDLKKNLTIC
jgi:hypothetical protein